MRSKKWVILLIVLIALLLSLIVILIFEKKIDRIEDQIKAVS